MSRLQEALFKQHPRPYPPMKRLQKYRGSDIHNISCSPYQMDS